MKHNHRLNGLSLGQGTIPALSGHSTLHSWWLNDNGSISTKAMLTAYSKSRSPVREVETMLDHARDSWKMKSVLLILPLHPRDEVRDHLASVSSHFNVKFYLHLSLILLFLALSFYTRLLERADVIWDLLKGSCSQH